MTDEFDFRKAKKEVLNPNMDKYVDEIVRVCRKWFRGIDSPSPRVPQLEQEIQQQIRKAQRDVLDKAYEKLSPSRFALGLSATQGTLTDVVAWENIESTINQLKKEQTNDNQHTD